jgi:hypothetical protein
VILSVSRRLQPLLLPLLKSQDKKTEELVIDNKFQDIPERIVDPVEKEFLIESINCYSINAYRASVIMLWITIIYHFYSKIDSIGYNSLQKVTKKKFPRITKYHSIKHKKELSRIKDADLLLVLQDLNIVDPNVRKSLARNLEIRNSCAHSNPYKLSKGVVDAYFDDLLQNILLNSYMSLVES